MIAETLMSVARKMGGSVVSDLQRLVRNKKYEFDDQCGLLISGAHVRGDLEVFAPDGKGWLAEHNLWTIEGKNHALDVILHGGTAVGTWYVAPFSGNVTVVDTWTAATFTAAATEVTAYSESTRVAYVETAASSGSVNNTASPAVFTASTDAVSIYGGGLLSVATKSATTGTLLAASKYSSARVLATTGDTLGIRWTISL